MTHKSIREIGIYWNIKNLEEGDIIGLYDSEPRQVNAKAIFIFQPNNTRGIMNTNIHADFVATSELQFEDQCLSQYYSVPMYPYVCIYEPFRQRN